MKIFFLTVVLLAGCVNTTHNTRTNEDPRQALALFVANPTPRWSGMSFRDSFYACNAVFVAFHIAVTSTACFFAREDGTRVYDRTTIVLESLNHRYMVEDVSFSEDFHLAFLSTSERGTPVHFHFGKEKIAYGEQLRLIGSSIQGFRKFTELMSEAMVRATKFSNQKDEKFFVSTKDADEVRGSALFRKSGEFAGITVQTGELYEEGEADQGGEIGTLAVSAEVILRELKEITR